MLDHLRSMGLLGLVHALAACGAEGSADGRSEGTQTGGTSAGGGATGAGEHGGGALGAIGGASAAGGGDAAGGAIQGGAGGALAAGGTGGASAGAGGDDMGGTSGAGGSPEVESCQHTGCSDGEYCQVQEYYVCPWEGAFGAITRTSQCVPFELECEAAASCGCVNNTCPPARCEDESGSVVVVCWAGCYG